MLFDISSEKRQPSQNTERCRKHLDIIMHVLLIYAQEIYYQVNRSTERKTIHLKTALKSGHTIYIYSFFKTTA